MSKNKPIIFELISFIIENKRWWLIPIIIMLVIIGILIMLGQSSPLSPFVYALF